MNMIGGTFEIKPNGAKFYIFKFCDNGCMIGIMHQINTYLERRNYSWQMQQGKRDYYARAINLR